MDTYSDRPSTVGSNHTAAVVYPFASYSFPTCPFLNSSSVRTSSKSILTEGFNTYSRTVSGSIAFVYGNLGFGGNFGIDLPGAAAVGGGTCTAAAAAVAVVGSAWSGKVPLRCVGISAWAILSLSPGAVTVGSLATRLILFHESGGGSTAPGPSESSGRPELLESSRSGLDGGGGSPSLLGAPCGTLGKPSTSGKPLISGNSGCPLSCSNGPTKPFTFGWKSSDSNCLPNSLRDGNWRSKLSILSSALVGDGDRTAGARSIAERFLEGGECGIEGRVVWLRVGDLGSPDFWGITGLSGLLFDRERESGGLGP